MAKQKSTSKLTYSIVIIVKNDRGISNSLKTLRSLVGRKTNCEVVVVDASDPATLADIKEANNWVRWLYYKNNTGKRLTIPEQRNMGIAKSKGDVVVFLDANCIPSKTWFHAIQEAFEKDERNVVTGIIKSVGGNTLHDAGYEGFAHNAPIEECGAANLSVRRKVFEAAGVFDEDMAYGEDVDFVWRVRDAGFEIIFRKDVEISHDWGEFAEEKRRAFRYGVSRTMLYKKHPNRIRNLLGYDINMLIYPGFLLLLPSTIWFPYYPLLLLVPLLKNLRNNPIQKTTLHFVYGIGAISGLFKDV